MCFLQQILGCVPSVRKALPTLADIDALRGATGCVVELLDMIETPFTKRLNYE